MCQYAEITVNDFLELLLKTDVDEAENWVRDFRKRISAVSSFLLDVFTPERGEFVVKEFSDVISRSLSLQYHPGMLWQAHIFMDEVRQKAAALSADVDLAEAA